jgi:hypothetical protein
MQINVTWDTSVTSLASPLMTEFESAVSYAVNLYDQMFTNPVTINIDVGWGEVDGHLFSGALGESITNVATYSYDTVRGALNSTANASGDPAQLAGVSSLPQTNPTNGSITIATAEAKALGLPLPLGTPSIDGYVGFAADPTLWSFSPTATPTGMEYYFIGVAEHEISEVMGRFSDIGTGDYSVLDLFRYSAPGTPDLANSNNDGGTTAYFSIDGGTTNLGTWNNVAQNGDLGDWTSGPAPGGHDAFNASGSPGVINTLSLNDITLMNVLGYDTTACFMPRTMIRTPNGEVMVETLKRGDLILTTNGQAAPVSWVGRQTVSTQFADPLRVLPIRIKAGAIADNVPSRDLLLSPDHAVLVDGALIQAGALVNGASILRETDVPQTFIYYHVEVDDHSLIFAENAPAETFVDNVDRMNFDNWAEHQALYPEGKSINELPYPRAKAHRQVPVATRVKLGERAQAIGAAADVAAA